MKIALPEDFILTVSLLQSWRLHSMCMRDLHSTTKLCLQLALVIFYFKLSRSKGKRLVTRPDDWGSTPQSENK